MTKKKDEMQELGGSAGLETIELTELKEGEDTFLSYGYSNVKVTKNGKIVNVKLPIRSSGITELIEDFKEKEPKPPSKDVLVTPDSDQGKQMKISEKKWVKMPDLTDPAYVKAYGKYESDLGIAILLKGLAVTLKDKDGNEVTNSDRKIEVLKGMGMSGPQFTQVVQDIRSMTEWNEEELRSFFGGSSVS